MKPLRAIVRNARLFWEGATLSYIALFRWLRPTTYIASKIAMPLFQMLFFTFIGTFGSSARGAAFYVVGNAVQIAAVSGIYGVTMSISGDRMNGTLPYLFGTPANRLMMFFGRAFIHVIDGYLGVIIGFLWGAVLFHVDVARADLPVLALTVLVTTASTSGLGMLMGCVGLVTRNVMFVNNAVYFLLLILSGANIPLSVLPGVLRDVSQGLPLTNGIAAARLIVSGAGISGVGPFLMRELLIGVCYVIVAYFAFRWFEVVARHRGSLETI
jgi:ABC-2 type transport system permease protein